MNLPGFTPCSPPGPIMATGDDVAGFWKSNVVTQSQFRPDNEWSLFIFLDADNGVVGHLLSSSGSSGWVRQPLRGAILGVALANANSVLAVHNHPGQERICPSEADHANRTGLEILLGFIEARLADYCVIASDGSDVFSFRDKGLLEAVNATWEACKRDALEVACRGMLDGIRAQMPLVARLHADLAAETGQTEESLFFQHVSDKMNERYLPQVIEDRRQWFTAAVISAAGEKQLELLQNADAQADAAGISLTELLWRDALATVVAKYTAKPQKDLRAHVSAQQ